MSKQDSKKYNVAVVGPKDMVSGFRALGVDIFPAETSSEALDYIKEIRRITLSDTEEGKKYAVVMVIDELIKEMPKDEYERISQGALPALLSIPGVSSNNTESTNKLRALAEKAIGSDILS